MSNTIIIWVCVAILVFIFIAIYKVVKTFVINPIMRDKDATLYTPLNAFRESNKYDTIIKDASKNAPASISQLYEEMCINNPCAYEDDPNLSKVISDYKNLLKGKILDPEAKHAPSEYLEGISNNDYAIYLKSQIRVLGKVGKDVIWFKEELKRFAKCEKEELYEADFMINFSTMGAPESILSSLVSENRMETFSPDDWKELVAKVKEYAKLYSSVDISYFLELINDKAILLDEAKMEAFHQLRELNIDEELAAAYIRRDLSSDDFAEVSDIMERYAMTCEEALEKVLSSKKSASKKEALKRSYKDQVLGR